jgi:integrase
MAKPSGPRGTVKVAGKWYARWTCSLGHEHRKRAEDAPAARRLYHLASRECPRQAVQSASMTFAEYADQWLGHAELRLRASTVAQYRSRFRRLLPLLGFLPLKAITRGTIRELIQTMVRQGNRRYPEGRPIARGTVRDQLKAVAAILTTAHEDGLIAANPCRGMNRQIGETGQPSQRIEIFQREELDRLLAVAETDWPAWHPFILVLARAGLRLGEAIALEWPDVDWTGRVLRISRSCSRGRLTLPKNGRARLVDMSPLLASVLRHRQVERAEFAGRVFGPGVKEARFREGVWRPLLKRAGLRYRKPHVLRHSFASTLIANGESLPYIAAQLGHHSPAFTLAVYGHLMPSATGRGVDRLDDLAGRSVSESVTVSAKSAGRLLRGPSSVMTSSLPVTNRASSEAR